VSYRVDNAIMLAAGFGSRFSPITFEIPKGLVPVFGKPMIERQIEQLHEKGIWEIVIVTGYLHEKFDYLKEKYEGIKLIYNEDYAVKNNLSSLYKARHFLKNSYILSSDNWLRDNMFHAVEERSWYSAVYHTGDTREWALEFDGDDRITGVTIGGRDAWVMYGPVFFCEDFSSSFKEKLYQYYHTAGTEKFFWEDILKNEVDSLDIYINKQDVSDVLEFESLEELRAFDKDYGYNTGNQSLQLICRVFNIKEKDIQNIELSKAGMTNDSFSFVAGDHAYIYRHPGQGSNTLISREREKAVYGLIAPLGIADEVVYFDAATGVKISRFYRGARNTDAHNSQDVADSLEILRTLHGKNLKADFSFSIGHEIRRYLNILAEKNNIKSLVHTRMYLKMLRLLAIIKKMKVPRTLCHIDVNPDNFIRLQDGTLRLIDWEYSGMSDPILDLAMYAIYSYYYKREADNLLHLYLGRTPTIDEKIRFYAYMALGGFLWMLWTEYKKFFGVEFGEYGLKMRQYAEVYSGFALSLARKKRKGELS
jgi:CTP:phosphocholine cytidylyltransferase-like protein/thiamine kinase-like enzyme